MMGMYDHWKLRAVIFVVFILPRILLLYVLPILVVSFVLALAWAHFMTPFVYGLSHQVP